MSSTPVHLEVLAAATRVAGRSRTFHLRDVVAALPHLNAGTVRTHVTSRCCVNAPAHHQTRWRYFRKVGRGEYCLEKRSPARAAEARPAYGWQDRVLAALPTSIDPTLIAESLERTPTERLEHMRAAALSLERMRRR